jgi:branched-subunit amino acid ABC-type transport system permease component
VELFLVQVFNSLTFASLLFIVSAGLSLIFGLMNVVNLAHGSFFMIGAFLGLTVQNLTGSFWAAIVISPLVTALIGLLMEAGFMRRLYRRGHLDQILLTFGFSLVFVDAVKWIWGAEIRSLVPSEMLSGALPILGGSVTVYRVFLIAMGLGLYGLLWLCLEKTQIGALVRAGVEDGQMASGLGINVSLLFSSVFAFGVGLAALAGVAAGPITGLYPGMDTDILIPAFIIVVIGGLGDLTGAFVGSLLVGFADTFGKAFLPDVSLFMIYIVMIVVLVARPTGLFGVAR